MNDNIRTITSAITLIVMFASMVFTAGQMWSKINENTTAIAERKLTGKTVREHGHNIIEIQTKIIHFEQFHEYIIRSNSKQDQTVEDIRVRVRALENKSAQVKIK